MSQHPQNSLHLWKRRIIAAAAVAFVCMVFAPQQAHASCGDYVMIGGHSQTNGNDLHSGHESDSQPGTPICRGAGCRERRESPASPPTRITLDEHSWGLPPTLVDQAPQHSLFCDRSAESSVAIFQVTGIFRPPRMASAV